MKLYFSAINQQLKEHLALKNSKISYNQFMQSKTGKGRQKFETSQATDQRMQLLRKQNEYLVSKLMKLQNQMKSKCRYCSRKE